MFKKVFISFLFVLWSLSQLSFSFQQNNTINAAPISIASFCINTALNLGLNPEDFILDNTIDSSSKTTSICIVDSKNNVLINKIVTLQQVSKSISTNQFGVINFVGTDQTFPVKTNSINILYNDLQCKVQKYSIDKNLYNSKYIAGCRLNGSIDITASSSGNSSSAIESSSSSTVQSSSSIFEQSSIPQVNSSINSSGSSTEVSASISSSNIISSQSDLSSSSASNSLSSESSNNSSVLSSNFNSSQISSNSNYYSLSNSSLNNISSDSSTSTTSSTSSSQINQTNIYIKKIIFQFLNIPSNQTLDIDNNFLLNNDILKNYCNNNCSSFISDNVLTIKIDSGYMCQFIQNLGFNNQDLFIQFCNSSINNSISNISSISTSNLNSISSSINSSSTTSSILFSQLNINNLSVEKINYENDKIPQAGGFKSTLFPMLLIALGVLVFMKLPENE